MARLKMYYEWDLEAAAEEFKKAIELNPNLAEAHEQYGYCLALSGNYQEALKFADPPRSTLDPFSLMNNNHIALLYWMAGDYKKGIAQGKRLIELDPNFYGGHYLLGLMYCDLKRYDEAVDRNRTLRQSELLFVYTFSPGKDLCDEGRYCKGKRSHWKKWKH